MGPTVTIGSTEVALLAPNPVPLLAVVAAALLYARACSVLAGRGRRVPTWQRTSYFAGLALILVATQTLIDPVGENGLLSLHMAQHLLIADLPAPLLLLGVRAPVVYFFWPKVVLVRAARITVLRRAWAVLRRPPIALGVWLIVLYAWHVPALYELALRNRAAHDIEHVMFALTGVLAWWPLLDPTHARVEGRIWKAGYVFAARTVGGVLGILMLTIPRQIYSAYGDAPLAYGVTVLGDQRSAGGMMMLVDFTIVTVGVLGFIATIDTGDANQPPVRESVSDTRDPVASADDSEASTVSMS